MPPPGAEYMQYSPHWQMQGLPPQHAPGHPPPGSAPAVVPGGAAPRNTVMIRDPSGVAHEVEAIASASPRPSMSQM
jgi:hypothetical protein